MSSEQSSLDPELIEQTKQQIRSLVAEIAQLSKEEVAPEEFYGQFLQRVVSALAAVGGAVWAKNEEGRLSLQYQINLQETKLRDNEEGQAQHGRLLYKCFQEGEGLLVPPHSGTGEGDDDTAANPTDFLLVLGPLKTDLETVGVVEVFQRSETSPNTQKGYLRFLMQMCELATDFLKSHQLRHFSDRQVLWSQLEDFTHLVHTHLDPRETAYTIANEGRRLIECDRVSVAILHGNKCTIEAVSGQDLFDKRSNVIRLLGKLATAVVATGEPVWYTGDTSDMAPQVEDAVQEYIDESHSKNVAVLPLVRPDPPEEDDPRKREAPQEPVGALIVEQIEDSRVPQSMIQRVEVVCRHSSTALANSLEHQSLFLMPVWRAIGKSKWILRARTLPKTISITIVILLALIALAVWPADFELYSKGTLEPVLRNNVFAGIEGVVDDVFVTPEDKQVKKGDLLVKLSSIDMQVAMTDVRGRRDTTLEQTSTINKQLTSRLPRAEQQKLQGQLAALRKELQSLNAQIKLYEKKKEKLEVLSPSDGEVLTWDAHKLLIHRPVQPGQRLLEIADLTGPWQLELTMPEDRMGYINKAQNGLYAKYRKQLRKALRSQLGEVPDEQLEAELAKTPNDQLCSKLREINGAELHEQFKADLAEILEYYPEEAANPLWQAKLVGIGNETAYEKARADLREVLDDSDPAKVPLGEFRAELRGLLDDGLDSRLQVTFILASDPDVEFQGAVNEIDLSAEIRGEEGNTVLMKVEVDKHELPPLSPGTTVNANVYCGRRPIGFVWFHDLIAFVQARILFRYF